LAADLVLDGSIVMAGTIDFDYQTCLVAIEVSNEPSNYMLPPEFKP
jgi:hypothetical protein